MRKHISDYFGLHIRSHSEIGFVDIPLFPDTKLFIDPCLIEYVHNPLNVKFKETITSYFDYFYKLYYENYPDLEKKKLFDFAHEINATSLGYGKGDNGRGSTADKMLFDFRTIEKLIEMNLHMDSPIDIPLFLNGFAEDRLSDMLTNILFQDLSQFTIEQCEKYGILLQTELPQGYTPFSYWDKMHKSWIHYGGKYLIIEEKVVLLVPKSVVRKRYFFQTSQYFTRIILQRLQKQYPQVDKYGEKQKPPSKKELAKMHKSPDESTRDAVIRLTVGHADDIKEYNRLLAGTYPDKCMTDKMLDNLIYLK